MPLFSSSVFLPNRTRAKTGPNSEKAQPKERRSAIGQIKENTYPLAVLSAKAS